MNIHEIRVENVVLAENDISVIVKPGHHDSYNNPHFSKNWFITALARPDCPKCYSSDLGS
jgi:hypothetical protein